MDKLEGCGTFSRGRERTGDARWSPPNERWPDRTELAGESDLSGGFLNGSAYVAGLFVLDREDSCDWGWYKSRSPKVDVVSVCNVRG